MVITLHLLYFILVAIANSTLIEPEMPKSIDDLDIIINPGPEMWKVIVHELGVQEGWPFTEEDYTTWITSFPEFWLHTAIERCTGKFVASLFVALDEASTTQEKLFSIGFYYCNPEWRGMNIGTMLFNKIMDIIGDENAVLNGVLKMSPKYASKYGFSKMTPWKHRFASFSQKDVIPIQWNGNFSVKNVSDIDFADIVKYDETISSRPRPKYLQSFTAPSDKVFSRVLYNEKNEIVAFASFRVDVKNNIIVGPFYADNKDAASALLSTSLKELDFSKYGSIGFLYPGCNEDANSLFTEITGGKTTFQDFTQLAFTKHIVNQPAQKIFAMSECASSFI